MFSPLNNVITEFDCTLWKMKSILTYMGPGISACGLDANIQFVTVALGFFACANPPCTCAAQALFPEQ
jgi:hypothetical protein